MYTSPSDILIFSKIYASNLPFWKSVTLNSELNFFRIEYPLMSKWWEFHRETQNSFSDVYVFVNTVFWESAIFIVAMETIL